VFFIILYEYLARYENTINKVFSLSVLRISSINVWRKEETKYSYIRGFRQLIVLHRKIFVITILEYSYFTTYWRNIPFPRSILTGRSCRHSCRHCRVVRSCRATLAHQQCHPCVPAGPPLLTSSTTYTYQHCHPCSLAVPPIRTSSATHAYQQCYPCVSAVPPQ
jgi:hypothetical protein